LNNQGGGIKIGGGTLRVNDNLSSTPLNRRKGYRTVKERAVQRQMQSIESH
jgi:hypothetical protein